MTTRSEQQLVNDERYMRQRDIYDPNERTNDHVTLIGCGGIGSFTALGIAKLGVKNITLIDADEVEEHNVPNQLFVPSDAGTNKAEVLYAMITQGINEFANVNYYPVMMPSDEPGRLSGLVISGLDSMEARTEIWNESIKLNPRISLYIDARLSGQFIIAYSVNPAKMSDIESYEKTLYSDDEAEDISCTSRGIIDVGLQVSSMLTRSARRHFAGEDVPAITMMNQETYTTTQGDWVE